MDISAEFTALRVESLTSQSVSSADGSAKTRTTSSEGTANALGGGKIWQPFENDAVCLQRELAKPPKSPGEFEPVPTNQGSLVRRGMLTRQSGQRNIGEQSRVLEGGGYDRGIKAKTLGGGAALEVDDGAGDRGPKEGDEEKGSAQEILIGWIQTRQRECATLISLCCVTVIFVNHLRNGVSNILSFAVNFVPLVVNLLLARDIFVKWDKRRRRRQQRLIFLGENASSQGKNLKNEAPGGGGVSGGSVGGVVSPECAREWHRDDRPMFCTQELASHVKMGPNSECKIEIAGKGSLGVDSADGMGTGDKRRGESTQSLGSRSSPSSGSLPGGDEGSASCLETSVQESIRLLCRASEGVQDADIRRQLEHVATLLSDSNFLNVVNEGAIRDTQSYIENILQAFASDIQARRNWRKLRKGMVVVQSMIRRAASNEEAEVEDDTNKSDDHLLGNICQDIHAITARTDASQDSSAASDPWDWDEQEIANFEKLNHGFIQGQQLELRDLACDRNSPKNTSEHPNKEKCAEPLDVSDLEAHKLPRLSTLDEKCIEDVSAMMANGQFLSWEFNVFNLEELSGGHSLWYSAMSTFSHYNFIGAFGLRVDRLNQLFLCVEANYCCNPAKPNSYHTHVHAADVTLAVAHFLSVKIIASSVRSVHGVALLMAAIMHDYRHPGVSNGYLVRDLWPIAVTYNDSSVLENFHAAEGFKLLMDPKFDFFKGWKPEEVKSFRQAYIKCILATDLALSMEYISKFQSLNIIPREGCGDGNVGKGNGKERSMAKTGAGASDSIQSQILLLLQMVLKVADVAHPCKPWKIHRKWSDLITEEFCKQGDLELAQGLIVSPLCDRRSKNLPKSQCDFIDFIVRPCVTIFSAYCEISTWNDQLESNFQAWKNLDEAQGGVAVKSSPTGSVRRCSNR